MKRYYSILIACLLLSGKSVAAQPTSIETMFPDEEFRNYCLKNFDLDANGSISRQEADKVKIIAIYKKVQSAKGIEYFPNLRELSCTSEKVTELDISKNTQLEKLYCSGAQITKLNLANNGNLTSLYCSKTLITELNLSDVPLLITLFCEETKIVKLDLTPLKKLETLYCSGNNWKELNLSGNPKLESVRCQNNALTHLDLSNNTLIYELFCGNNKLTSLNLSKQKNLQTLYCDYNNLAKLDLAGNKSLYILRCNDNSLTILSLLNNKGLQSLTCSNNKLSKLDLSKNYQLQYLDCSANKITNLVLTNNNDLKELNCADNILKELIFPAAPNEGKIAANYANNLNLKVIKNESLKYSNEEIYVLLSNNLGNYPVDSLHNLIPYVEGSKWGLIDRKTRVAVGKPIYRTIGFFNPISEGTFNSEYEFSMYQEHDRLKVKLEKIPDSFDIMGMEASPEPNRVVSSADGYKGFTVDADGKLATYSDIYKAQSYDHFNVSPFMYKGKYYADATLKDTNYKQMLIDTEGNYAPGFEQVYRKIDYNTTASSADDVWLSVEEVDGKRYFQNMEGKRKLEGELFIYPFTNRYFGLMCLREDNTSAVLDMQTMTWLFPPQNELKYQDVKYASKEKLGRNTTMEDKPKVTIYIRVMDNDKNQYYIDTKGTKYIPARK